MGSRASGLGSVQAEAFEDLEPDLPDAGDLALLEEAAASMHLLSRPALKRDIPGAKEF